MIYYFLGGIAIVAFLILIIVIIYNSFQVHIIAINEAEEYISSSLKKKFDLLNKSIGIIKGNIKKDEDILESVVKLRSRKLSHIELDTELNNSISQFYSVFEKNN